MVPIVTMVVLMTLTTLITSRAAIIVTVLALYQAATTGSPVASAEPSPYTQGMREPALMKLVLPAPLADAMRGTSRRCELRLGPIRDGVPIGRGACQPSTGCSI